MSDKFCFKELYEKAAEALEKYSSMFRSSMMNKPKMDSAFAVEPLMNEQQVVLPLGPTHMSSLDASSKS